MNIDTFLMIIGITVIIFIMIFALVFCIYKFIIMKNRTDNATLSMNLTINDLLDAVSIVVSNEISIYERNAFDNKGMILSNSTFDNYYKDIMKNILNALSPQIIERLGFYITKDSLYRLISREVQVYLNNKIV